MKLYVGQAALRGGVDRYPFDLLELSVAPNLPQPKKLAAFREALPKCVFALRLPPQAIEPGAEQGALFERVRRSRDALDAGWCVLTTGPRTTPTAQSRAQLGRLFETLAAETGRLAWEPHGLWSRDEAERLAEDLGVTLVRDLSREPAPPGAVIYTRLRALGYGARVGARAVERVAESVRGASEAYVVIEGQGTARAATLLRELSA